MKNAQSNGMQFFKMDIVDRPTGGTVSMTVIAPDRRRAVQIGFSNFEDSTGVTVNQATHTYKLTPLAVAK